MLKQLQKEIAELLVNGKQEYARIRVEAVIREKLLLQAYEILELYLELLTVRTQLIAKTKELPRDMMEAVSSIIYAAQVNINLIRCLLVEPPLPEDKLAMLSDIAQEHKVEWDAAAAARDLGVGALGSGLAPSGLSAAAPYAQHPPHSAAMPGGMPVAPPPLAPLSGTGHPQYANAQQAAQAAAVAAAQAHAAAEYAAQMAAAGGGMAAAHPHMHMHPPPGAAPAPPPGWLSQPPAPPGSVGAAPSTPSSVGSEVPHFAPGGGVGPVAGAMPAQPRLPEHPDGAPPPPGHGAAAGGYVLRSNEEIQRAYDAMPGPPTKGGSAVPTAPSPPPAGALSGAPSDAELPSVPAPPAEVEDEYEELTRRLEALKKS
ncbi:hypothetical protein GPECTOR_11g162 [Gonium pectorale]|uniref:IST1-like protein n=1 Tax=Gonium pectorale TaxID=33097 RepID=A0A150GPI9_GONPE|nr:hypothetical protein GPECTOR_11g162 [Gonium pectorale]|eukprot:KXZ51714.1 hypothetical protein GPECTOR_11g162 [Gonium pectorale]